MLRGRDDSLLENVHFGLCLPATIPSFGEVRPVRISDWSVVKPGQVLKHTPRHDRATFKNKRELFDHRCDLAWPNTMDEDDLKNLSMHEIWRLFYVVKGKLVREQKEQFVALSGTSWAKHAQNAECSNKHDAYCKTTMLAYMPCPSLEGTSTLRMPSANTLEIVGRWPCGTLSWLPNRRGVRHGSFAIMKCTTI